MLPPPADGVASLARFVDADQIALGEDVPACRLEQRQPPGQERPLDSPREKTMRRILVAAAMFLATLAVTVTLAATGFM